MAQSKKELVLAALNGKPVDRVPVGFWCHFTEVGERQDGLINPAVVTKNIEGHKKYYEAFRPDFVKIMSDGYFGYPNERLRNLKSLAGFGSIEPLGENHPWIKKQVELVRTLKQAFGDEVLLFYNVFAPVKFFRLLQSENEHQVVADLIAEDKTVFQNILAVIAQDLAVLSEKVITEGGADGIYFCVQSIQNPAVNKEVYQEVIAPADLAVLNAANAASANNILHVCGFKGLRNDVTWFKDYPAKAVNWAVNVEGVSLAEGRKIFGGKAVIGGFDNTQDGYLYKGSREEVEAFTAGILKGSGKRGVILGADCTVPNDIELERLGWVREAASRV